jgi:hypothetical protein
MYREAAFAGGKMKRCFSFVIIDCNTQAAVRNHPSNAFLFINRNLGK